MVFMKNIKPCSLKVESIFMQHKRALVKLGLHLTLVPLHALILSTLAQWQFTVKSGPYWVLARLLWALSFLPYT
jgi:hypothetical protein